VAAAADPVQRFDFDPPRDDEEELDLREEEEDLRAVDFDVVDFELARVGSFLRLALAIFSSSDSLIDLLIWREAPLRLDFGRSPRFAESAAPAAICCFLDLAGMAFPPHDAAFAS
jgi:hypothetical protein